MQISGACPKCGSTEIIRIPGFAGAYGAGNVIPAGATIFSSVKVARLLCGACGFVEEWVDVADIDRLRTKYASS